jgi:hypothetical protein
MKIKDMIEEKFLVIKLDDIDKYKIFLDSMNNSMLKLL